MFSHTLLVVTQFADMEEKRGTSQIVHIVECAERAGRKDLITLMHACKLIKR